MRREISILLMVTGGLRRLDAMNAALETGCADMIGIGRPMCVTDAPAQLLNGLHGSLVLKISLAAEGAQIFECDQAV